MSLQSSAIRVAASAVLAFGGGLAPAIAGQKALLIGAGAYPHLEATDALQGPQNDVRAMKTFLLQEWEFSSSDVRVLLDEQATKAAILEALEVWLPNSTETGDRIVVYFSGHGTQVPDGDGDEPDGMDEAFLPNDYGRNGSRVGDLLIDDELADWRTPSKSCRVARSCWWRTPATREPYRGVQDRSHPLPSRTQRRVMCRSAADPAASTSFATRNPCPRKWVFI